MNELSIFAKFVKSTCINDSEFFSLIGDKIYEESIGDNDSTITPVIMTVKASGNDTTGNFGMRFKVNEVYQIKAVVQGVDYTSLEHPANIIDRLFDWSNQIDISTGRPKCQQVYTDPDNGIDKIMILSLFRKNPLKYTVYLDGINYSNLGGMYSVEYYTV